MLAFSSQRWLGTQANETTVFHSKKGVKQAQTRGYDLVKLVSRREQHDSGQSGANRTPEARVSPITGRFRSLPGAFGHKKWNTSVPEQNGWQNGAQTGGNDRFGAKRPFHDPNGATLGTGGVVGPGPRRGGWGERNGGAVGPLWDNQKTPPPT